MICVLTLCTTVCARLADRAFVLWPTLAGGHPVLQAVAREHLAGMPVLLHPRMGPTPEHPVHQLEWGCWCSLR